MRKKILITGCSGFLGKSVHDFLSKKKAFAVFGVDIKGKASKNSYFTCDLSNQKEIRSILIDLKPDYIFHLAGGRGQLDNDALFKAIFLTTKCLLGAVLSIDNYNPRVIIPGSAAEYGDLIQAKGKIDEKTLSGPNSWYGLVKLMQTNLALFYVTQGVDVVIGRIFNVLGKRTPLDLSIGRFAEQIVSVEKTKIKRVINTYNLSSIRDFLDIDDVCSALFAVAKKGEAGQIYNICSGSGLSIRDVLARLLKLSEVKNIFINEKVECVGSIRKSVGSNAKLKKATGWKPKVNIEESLTNTIKYYRRLK